MEYEFKFNTDEINLILKALTEYPTPYVISSPVINKIYNEIAKQTSKEQESMQNA